MIRDILVGVDAGTSVIKSVAFTLRGAQIAACAEPNVYANVAGGGVEQDIDRTWQGTAATLRGLSRCIPDLADRVAGIAVTGQGDGTWLIDAAGRPTAPALLWLDARAAEIAERLRVSAAGRAVFERTGTGVNACQQSTQLLWLKRNRPGALKNADTAFHCKDWLYFKLTGTRASDPSESIFTFGDVRTRALSERVIAAFGLEQERRLIPPIVDGAREAGALTAAAARETGLDEGIPVTLAYVDVVCTALGGGLYDLEACPGCTIVGSTGMHMRYVPSAADLRLNAECTGYVMPFPLGGFAQLQSNMAASINIDWMLDLGGGALACAGQRVTRQDILRGLDEAVLRAAPATLLFNPYISEAGERGPFVDPSARAQFIGLSSRHGYHDLMRAVFEGLAFAARDCYAAMGSIPNEVRLSGGAARSKALKSIMAAVLGADVRASAREEAGAAGAAMIAALGLNLYPDLASCVAEWVTPLLEAKLPPDPKLAEKYERMFPVYVAARQANAPIWRRLAAQRD